MNAITGFPRDFGQEIERERQAGYPSLTPLQRQFALEFIVSGTTLKKIARVMDQPLTVIRTLYADPLVRAFIADFQKELAAHRIVNEQWVEAQLLALWPKFIGQEPVDIVTAKGLAHRAKKFHAAETAAILKHFGGSQEQKVATGVQVIIDFGRMGVKMDPAGAIEDETQRGVKAGPDVSIIEGESSP